jgi:transcriptional regulator with XRE-family HTH domain
MTDTTHGEDTTDEQAAADAGDTVRRPRWDCLANWTEAEREYWWMGPFDGGIPGLVRRIRRILDVSQRGLAARLKVSQSVIARWETGRTSPNAEVLMDLLRIAKLKMSVTDEETGEEVAPMRTDGVLKHGGARFPAHVDLTVRGWWVPRDLRRGTSIEWFRCVDRSRAKRDPGVTFRVSPFRKAQERLTWGTPDDHPALHQQVAEAIYQDQVREGDRWEARELAVRRRWV